MNKKVAKIIIMFMLCFCFTQIKMPVYASETNEYFTVDNVQYKKLNSSTVAIWDASGVEGAYTILPQVKYKNTEYKVTQIGYKAFYNNEKLTSVAMPDTIVKIEDGLCEDWIYGAFKDCKNLKTVKFSKNLTYIGQFTFSGDVSLENVTIPGKVKTIMDEAFNGCTGITKLTIPASTVYVGQHAFWGISINKFTIPKTCEEFHFLALQGITTLTDIYVEKNNPYYTSLDGVMYSADMTKVLCYPLGKKDKKYTLPESVDGLETGLFSKHQYLKEIVLNSIIDIDGLGTALVQSSSVSSIKVSVKNPYLKSVDGVLFSKNGDTILIYPPAKKDKIYFVPSGTKHIGEKKRYTFETCKYLEELYIPASATTFEGIMWMSPKLKQVVFASECKITSICGFMFQKCTSLKSICFPKSLKLFSDDYHGNEFLFCEKLESIYVAEGAGIYKCKQFGCQSLVGAEDVTIYGEGVNNSLSEFAEYFYQPYVDVSKGCDKVLGVTFEDTVINVKQGAKKSVKPVIYPKVRANEKLSYISSNESIATIDAKGKVTGVGCGTCYITATSNDGAYARCQIKVSHVSKKKIKAATTKKSGKIITYCGICKKNISTKSISKIKSIKLSYKSKVYTGKKLKPTVQVKDKSGKKISKKYYTVSYKNNKKVGKATVTIKFKGNYSGTVKKKFTIKPKKTK